MFSYKAADAVSTWPEGKYDAVIVSVEEKTAKTSGNPMLVIGVEIYNKEGKTRKVTDRIVIPSATWKLKQIATAMGKLSEFNEETWDPFSMKDRRFSVMVTVKKSEDPNYNDDNAIVKYMQAEVIGGKPAKLPPASPISDKKEFAEEEIPF